VDPALLAILRCPDEHHAELTLAADEQSLTCTECGRIFEIREGIPVLLLDEARPAPTDARPDPVAGGASEKAADGATSGATNEAASQTSGDGTNGDGTNQAASEGGTP
jgi:uncharacterized protein YbaR (Trm112 family)